MKGPFKYLSDRFPYPFIYFDSWNPYPFIYLKREKGTPFGRSLPILTIIGSTQGGFGRVNSESRKSVSQKQERKDVFKDRYLQF